MAEQKEAEDTSVQSTENDKKNEKQTESSNLLVPSPKPFSQFVDGFQIPGVFLAECFRSAVSYKPRPDDLILVTYPKCGTTWTQHILMLILRHSEPVESQEQAFAMSPFLEITGAEGAETMPRPGVIKVHLPYHLTPRSDKAKYIYVTRNPKDCCVSYFHHMRNFPAHAFNGTFDEFFEFFISGNIDYGDYFDHLLSWYERRNDPNILFITYEEIKENPEEVILKMASFIDENMYAELLRNDPQKLQNVVKYSSFDYMKKSINQQIDDMYKLSKEDIMKSDLPYAMKKMFSNVLPPSQGTEEQRKFTFVRKGIIGDWRNYFSKDQSRRLNEKFANRTKGTDIPNLWSKYM